MKNFRNLVVGLALFVFLLPNFAFAQANSIGSSINEGVETSSQEPSSSTEQSVSPTETESNRSPIQRPEVDLELPFLPTPSGVPTLPTENNEQITDPESIRGYFLNTLLPQLGQVLLGLVVLVCFGMLLFAGGLYFTSFGNPDNADKAKKTTIFAIVGLVVAFMALVVVQLINSLPFG